MKIIVLHERIHNQPIVVKVNKINAVQKGIEKINDVEEEFSTIIIGNTFCDVKEHIDDVLRKIKKAEEEQE